ncbi:glycosyltransferase [uncultured Brevundimonas sp.]|uniref:glycosyltransferase n=1 Tax=uncultured Brevundimonas sp. TaxID=213418 RepID=UPI0026141AB3|nr:glycosyltransferase [uncultured Brevundimonas sp.]
MLSPPKDTPRIAIHITGMASGGAEKMCIVIARELLRRGYLVDLVLCQANGEYMSHIPEGVRLVDLKARRSAASLVPLIKYLHQTRPDVLISNLGYQNIVAVVANRIAGRPTRVFVTQHNNLSSQSTQSKNSKQRFIPFFYKFILPMADGVLAVSAGLADDMAKVVGYPRDRIKVLYNPAAPQDIERLVVEPIEDAAFSTGEPLVLAIGRLNPQKGFDTLIAAFARLTATRPARLAICGVGPLEDELKALAYTLGVADRVTFLGFQDNPLKFLNRANLFVLSSRFEGFGNVLVEALACGTSVVSTDCPHGPSEILENGRFGALVPVDDTVALAEAMNAMLETPMPAEILKARAHEYSPEKVVERYLNVIWPQDTYSRNVFSQLETGDV